MTATNRFLFDTDFGTDPSSPEAAQKRVKREEPIYTESDVTALKAEAFEQGLREGKSQSHKELETIVAEAMTAISAQLEHFLSSHEAKMTVLKQESAKLALSIASKFAPALIELAPETEVKKLIEDCLVDLHDEPRIVIRANEEVCENISGKIDEITNRSAFQGNLILLPDETRHAGDCRVEWADGGTERRLEDIEARLEEVINRFIRSTGETEQQTPQVMDQPVAEQF
ncbi:FliH/SctL family protein [Sneathiella sp.]|uniref:FliH/SctL family protein n=1 Tax=Sneathiella sp. TaxID=1964365 RepID=UPI002639C1EA|nr:FliH/SctL family protein [Sneathiella sp.]MDF2365920.1 FliH/SctL family protein [Sneathiella sp.]